MNVLFHLTTALQIRTVATPKDHFYVLVIENMLRMGLLAKVSEMRQITVEISLIFIGSNYK